MSEVQESAYFKPDEGYDKNVYENDWQNYVKIVTMLIIFYIFQGLHWWCNFELGIHDTWGSTYYNLTIFGTAVFVIMFMLFLGSKVNRRKLTHEYYIEKISEERQRVAEEKVKAQQKLRTDAEADLPQIKEAPVAPVTNKGEIVKPDEVMVELSDLKAGAESAIQKS